MTCRYCGLETGSGAGHRSQAECITALSEEIDRAKRLVSHARNGAGDDGPHDHHHDDRHHEDHRQPVVGEQ